MATTAAPPTVPGRTIRRAPWRSPADQPVHARPALLAICGIAVLLYGWGIDHSQYHAFYADAVRSMTQSWKGFFFGSFDPGNSITLDKLPGFLWPQAISARVLGFHPWALTLPQVLEGIACVLVLFRVVRRWAGADAALIACVAFLVTPVAAGLFRTAVEDPAFTLCVLLAADATGRAAESGRLRPLLAAGAWVGAGFQAKMLEAWAVLPALALAYLVSRPAARRRRFAHLALAGLVTLAVSASWVLAATLTPAADRPYIDGTTNNSAVSMVVGYNFLNRFASLGISAASTGSVSATQGGGHRERGAVDAAGKGGVAARPSTGGGTGGGADSGTGSAAAGAAFRSGGSGGGFGARNSWSKMLGMPLVSQTGWLYPFAAISLGCGLAWRRRRSRTDRLRAGFLLWGGWLATYFLVFSAGSVGGHTYYMGVVAVPLAALTGAGAVELWRAHGAGGWRAWALPVALGATVAWSAYICFQFTSYAPWLGPVVLCVGVVALTLLALRGRTPRFALGGLLAGLLAVLLAPGAWSAQVFAPATHGGRTGMMGSVGPTNPVANDVSQAAGGPRMAGVFGGSGSVWGTGARGGGRTARGVAGDGAVGRGARFGGAGSGTLTSAQKRLLDYARAHQGSATYVFAATSWSGASPYILSGGAHVLPLGGFTGRVPFPTLDAFRRLTGSGRLRYVLLAPPRGSRPGPTARINSWVEGACSAGPGVPTLYDCAAKR
jgi:4-amino-4-deoxy-L-arabinose transferase-like glycosyltransferase